MLHLQSPGVLHHHSYESAPPHQWGRWPTSLHRRPLPASRCAAGPSSSSGRQRVDVVGLGNLCVDAVLPLAALPPEDAAIRRQLLDQLTRSPPDRSTWEVGGNCNFMIAGSRLGMHVASVGHLGKDIYGQFMDEVLKEEGVLATTRIAPAIYDPSLDQTLICFVLVDPNSQHAFCSRYDFGPWPLLQGIDGLPPAATAVLRSSRAIFTNGFIFDELPLHIVQSACSDAIQHGSAVFFDPGPRCHTMLEGGRRQALDVLLDLSTVVLMTEEEAKVVTGHDDPEQAAHAILSRPGARADWCVVKLGGRGALLSSRRAKDAGTYRAPGVKVDVVDTVGCGDSFASAIVMGYVNDFGVEATLALANAVGAATATGRGAGRNVATAARVLQLLQQGQAGEAGGGDAATQRALLLLQRSLGGGLA